MDRELVLLLIQRIEKERHELVQALHDDIGQLWTVLKLSLQLARKAPADDAAAKLENCLHVIERGIEKSRALSLRIRPSMLDDFGLVAALDWFVTIAAAESKKGLKVHLQSNIGDGRLPPDLETAAFRIVEEVVQHLLLRKGTTALEIRVDQTARELEFTVDVETATDTPEVPPAALPMENDNGLWLSKLRTELLGGWWSFEAHSGHVQRVAARLPLVWAPSPDAEARS
jgi:signal transduction histidine kinase